MGVDFQAYDNDGLPDIHVTALNRQTCPMCRDVGDGLFDDTTSRSGLHRLRISTHPFHDEYGMRLYVV